MSEQPTQPAPMKLLIVEDNEEVARLVAYAAERAGFRAEIAGTAPAALALFDTGPSDLVIIDINLGEWSGLDLLRDIRRRSMAPVIMLTARDDEEDKILALELGADDYVTKPFSPRELVARVRAQLRRAGQEVSPRRGAGRTLMVGPLILNIDEHTAAKQGRPLRLSATEFRLLNFLMSRAGTVVETRAILKEVWGYDDPAGLDVVRVTVHRLRRKLEDDPASPTLLHTISGVGVLLTPRETTPEH